jgi:hypothetical protein
MVAAKRAAQARATAASREAKEAEELLSDLKAKFLAKKGGGGGGGGEPSLTDLLMANRESRQNKFADILSKYDSSEGRGGGGGKGGKSRGREMMIEDGSRMEEESGESPKRRARK